MRSFEFITEATELKSSIAAVNSDIGNPITQVYDAQERMARNWANTQTSMNGFQMMSAGIGARWYHQLGRQLVGHLNDLAKQAGKNGNGRDLYKFMGTIPSKWKEIEGSVPELLLDLGKKLDNELMVRNASKWIKQREAYYDLIEELKDSFRDHGDSRDEKPVEPKRSEKKIELGKQNAEVEKIVSSVIAKLPKDIQHTVRQAVARSADNKLLALKQELEKRGIKL